MTSDRQRSANRRNAKNSTGPRSPEGKARSSRNALRHGLAHDDTGDPEVAAWIENAARIIAGPHADDRELMEAAQELAMAQHQLNRVRRARVAVLDSEAHPRPRHRPKLSGADKLFIFAALEERLLEKAPNVKLHYTPFSAWGDDMRAAFAATIHRLIDEDRAKRQWLNAVLRDLGALERFEGRAYNRRYRAMLHLDTLKAAKATSTRRPAAGKRP